MSHREVALKAGLPKTKVEELSVKTSWEGVPVDVVDKFAKGCGVNMTNLKRQIEYVRRRKMAHLRKAPPSQRRMFSKLMQNITRSQSPETPEQLGL